MPTSDKMCACYTSLNGSTILPAVRTISGLPSRRNLVCSVFNVCCFGFKRPHKILGKSDCLELCCGSLKLAILFEGVLRPSRIAWARLKTGAPKLYAALIFLWLLSFYQEKESNNDFLKYSTVFVRPISTSTFGDQFNSFLAREISGFRCFGSSCGRGR